tara:strand:+ start:213 stop:335 length:123 start_codon:yes stop_codon:yes gene_type:complete
MEYPSQFNQAAYLLKFLNSKSGFFFDEGVSSSILLIGRKR